MDNLELMRQIPDGFIDLIYGDILYGTGRNFGDFKDLPAKRDVIEDFYLPRIQEMHRILKDTGSIYLQMDTRINHWVRCLMDDVFGYENFRNEIRWEYKNIYNGNKDFAKLSDVIIRYGKIKLIIFNQFFVPYSETSISRLRRNPSKKINWRGEKNIDEIIKRGKKMTDIWSDISAIKGNKIYETEKPKALLERIIKASSNEGDLVADLFCGSGTTCVVAKELNRNFIGCDISQRAIELTNKRLNEMPITLFGR